MTTMLKKTQRFTKDQGEDSKEVFQLFDMKGDDLIQAIIVITNIVLAKSAALQSNTIHLRGIIAGTNLCDHAPHLPLLLLPSPSIYYLLGLLTSAVCHYNKRIQMI